MAKAKKFLFGDDHRFLIEPFETRFGDTVWFVRDAEWVTDEEVRNGRKSPVVAQFDTVDEAKTYCIGVEDGQFRTTPHESAFIDWPELKERVR